MRKRFGFAIPLMVCVVVVGALAVEAGAASKANDGTVAKAAVLRIDDFPVTWTQKKRDTAGDAATERAASKISSCKQFASFISSNKKNPRALSPDFDLNQSSISNTVNVFTSEKAASGALATFGSSSVPTCLNKLFTALLKAQFAKDKTLSAQITSIHSQIAIAPGVTVGDESIAYAGSVVVALKNGQGITLDLGNEAIRVGRVVNDFAYTADSDISTVLSNAMNSSTARLMAALSTSP